MQIALTSPVRGSRDRTSDFSFGNWKEGGERGGRRRRRWEGPLATWRPFLLSQPGNITGGPVRKASGGFMGRPEIIPRLTRRGKVHRAKQIYGTPEIMPTRSSWRAPRRVFRTEILSRPSLAVFIPPPLLPPFGNGTAEAAAPRAFTESVDRGWILSQFIFFALKVLLAPVNLRYLMQRRGILHPLRDTVVAARTFARDALNLNFKC